MTKLNASRRVQFMSRRESRETSDDMSQNLLKVPQTKNRKKSAQYSGSSYCHSEWSTCDYSVLPKWLQDNDFLHLGHRPPLPSMLICSLSVFRVHTETGNILTHGFGLILFAVLAAFMLTMDSIGKTDRLMLGIYFIGAIICHFFSSTYHTYRCHSPSVSQIFHKLDYCGISMQIICSMIPALFYGLYDRPLLVFLYIGIGLILFVLAIMVSLWPKFGEPQYRALRAAVFLAFGLSNVIPGIHWLLIIEPKFLYPYCLVVIHGMLYVIGALLYAMRIPEKYFPGKFDIWFQSHQIFHVLVTLAALIHLIAIYTMLSLRAIDG